MQKIIDPRYRAEHVTSIILNHMTNLITLIEKVES